MHHDRAYLSVLSWPESASEDRRVELLVAAAGLDPYNAKLAVRRGTPLVVCLIDADISGEVVGALRGSGAEAFAPSRAEMEALPNAVRVRRVGRPRDAPGRLGLSLRDGGSVSFDPGEVSAVLRATVAASTSTTDTRSTFERHAGPVFGGGVAGAMLHAASEGPKRKTEFSALDIVELQLADGRRYRLDSKTAPEDRAERLRSGRDRMDELAVTLGELCGGAWVDHRFREFHCPPDVLRSASAVTGTKIVRTKDDGPRFEFFSAWTMLMLREGT